MVRIWLTGKKERFERIFEDDTKGEEYYNKIPLKDQTMVKGLDRYDQMYNCWICQKTRRGKSES